MKLLKECGEHIRHIMVNYEKENNTNQWDVCNLQNGCFMASALLSYFIPNSKFILGFFLVKNTYGNVGEFTIYRHAWIEVNGFIVDLTATQFNDVCQVKFDNVLILEKNDTLNLQSPYVYIPHLYGDEAQKILKEKEDFHYNEFLFNILKNEY